MIALEKEPAEGIFRKPFLIAGATKKMALTYIVGTVCAATVTIVDSLIAGVSIGQEALAAIAAAGPLLTLDQILHCLLGFGIDKLMVQAIGKGDRKKANRIFGAVLIAVPITYALVFGILILIERPLLLSITGDNNLVDMIVRYTVPLFIFSPFAETFLCIERAFRIDGRAKLFSKRAIVTNLANIVFDILMVTVLNLGISGLAWASVISTTIGFSITLSHFFSKKRTISPDFSVIRSRKELIDYVRQDIRLGRSATLDEVLDGVALSAQTAAIGAVGGVGGLAIWTVFKSLQGIMVSVGNGISASVSVHTGLLYGQGDYDGVRYSVWSGIRLALITSLIVITIILLFAKPIAEAYSISQDLQQLCARYLRLGCMAFPAVIFLNITTTYLPSVNKPKLASRLVLLEHGLVIVSASIGYATGPLVFIVTYVLAVWTTSTIVAILLVRDRFWFVPERNPESIAGYSIQLAPDQIDDVGNDLKSQLDRRAYPAHFCFRVSLVIEESMSYIAQHNVDAILDADIELRQHEDGVIVTITDGGVPYNPLAETTTRDFTKACVLEKVIFLGLSEYVDYDRVLDLNRMQLYLEPSET